MKLENGNGEAERFYRQLSAPALIGFEACGNTQWFEDLLDRLGHEVWMGDAAAIRASYVRKQKTDRRDAAHILKLLIEGRFPRLWRPSAPVGSQHLSAEWHGQGSTQNVLGRPRPIGSRAPES